MRSTYCLQRTAMIGIATIALFAGGCGATDLVTPSVPEAASTPLESSVSAPAPSLVGPSLTGQLACGNDAEISFPANALDGSANPEPAQGLPGQALRAFVASPEAAGYPADGWRVVAVDAERIDFLAPGPESWWFVSVENIADQGGWQAWEYGRCDLRVDLPDGFGFATWELDPNSPLDPEATSLTVLATEVACSSGKSMAGRLEAPIVLAGPEGVTIAIVARTRPGGQDCQGNPAAPVTVELGAPLGDREVFDGSSFPAEPRGR